ncbi:glycine zipper 2TM domain-containing protein [Sphingobium sp. Sx8-8]|uniref:glycine zipper 2TM domain-containing protein n=1 Tax=Sphingobium sp. Sx8-8 TaxID=2933617 RepID=UPI001F56450E|nr:glycine zipper 2TM domain-containing protein [Sphingobium sp. Sx8-8]
MFRKMIATVSVASAAIMGIAAGTPALAQSNYHYSERYEGDDGSYYRSETYRNDDGYYDRGYRDYDRRPVEYRDEYIRERPRPYRTHAYSERCTSGTTGALVGGVLGGLLGREIGRGGRWDRPSTTGLILGAGAGALAGREVERSDCR